MTDYPFDQIFAADESNPANVASNGMVTLFEPGDTTETPIPLKGPNGQPLANPQPVNSRGFGTAYIAGMWKVAWKSSSGLTGFFYSLEGVKDQSEEASAAALAAQTAAESARQDAQTAATDAGTAAAEVAGAALATASNAVTASAVAAELAQTAAEAAAAATEGGGFAEDPGDPDAFIVTTKADGSVAVDPDDADALIFTT